MEVQLEEEYEDKQKVLREKRDLESRLNSVSEQVCLKIKKVSTGSHACHPPARWKQFVLGQHLLSGS